MWRVDQWAEGVVLFSLMLKMSLQNTATKVPLAFMRLQKCEEYLHSHVSIKLVVYIFYTALFSVISQNVKQYYLSVDLLETLCGT